MRQRLFFPLLAGLLTLASCGQQGAPMPNGAAAPRIPVSSTLSSGTPTAIHQVETQQLQQPAATAPSASTTPQLHGPAPTAESITRDGPYAVGTRSVSRWKVRGFGGGTLYFPANASAGERFAGVVTIPGYMEPGATMALFGRRLASHGFVVLVANPLNIGAYPSKRADMVLAAMRYLNGTAPVQSILDPARTALIGHSMGGGGVLEAAEQAQVSAVIAIHPWAQRSFPNVTAPTQVIGGGLDAIAPFSSYTLPIYQSLTDAKPKSLLTSLAGTHWAGVVDDPALQGRNLAFLKTFVDGDARYQPFYCAPAAAGTTFRTTATCP